MIFKYRGTTIRLFSRKLFILVTLGIGAIFAVLTLHEMIRFDASNRPDSTPYNGFYLNQPQKTTHLQEPVATLKKDGIKIDANRENTNNNIPQESLHVTHVLRRPTVKISSNKTVSPEIKKLRDIVRAVNEAQFIRNGDKFGTTLSEGSIVIIVQVHDRADYFSYLLKSLSRAKGIEEALLVISHDYYSEDINRHVEAIDFCKVKWHFNLCFLSKLKH